MANFWFDASFWPVSAMYNFLHRTYDRMCRCADVHVKQAVIINGLFGSWNGGMLEPKSTDLKSNVINTTCRPQRLQIEWMPKFFKIHVEKGEKPDILRVLPLLQWSTKDDGYFPLSTCILKNFDIQSVNCIALLLLIIYCNTYHASKLSSVLSCIISWI